MIFSFRKKIIYLQLLLNNEIFRITEAKIKKLNF